MSVVDIQKSAASVSAEADLNRFKIAASRRMLHRHGCDSWISGHVSARASDPDGAFWINPAQYFDETLPAEVLRVGFDMRIREGTGKPSPTIGFHSAIYQARPDVNSIVHVHADSVAILSTTQEPLGMYNISAVFFHESVVHYDYADGVDESQGASFARALGNAKALILPHHGVIIVSDSLAHATVEAMIFEKCARFHIAAKQIGGQELRTSDVLSFKELFKHSHRRNVWAANLRRLRRSDPDIFEGVAPEVVTQALGR
jgi:L-fuculose-phosphate aldolase